VLQIHIEGASVALMLFTYIPHVIHYFTILIDLLKAPATVVAHPLLLTVPT
jgi:hypothetical protein